MDVATMAAELGLKGDFAKEAWSMWRDTLEEPDKTLCINVHNAVTSDRLSPAAMELMKKTHPTVHEAIVFAYDYMEKNR